jgi:alpha-glucoside transport system substrate-binding protein
VKKKTLLALLILIVGSLALVAAGCGGDDGDDGANGEAGNGEEFTGTITILSLWGGSEAEAFQQVLQGFTEETGIRTQYETARDFVPVIRTRLAAGNPPMVAIIPRPGVMADLAREGSIVSLDDLGLDTSAIEENYSQAWLDLGTVDDELYGIAAKANSKSVVWYRPTTFQEMNLEPAENWDQLLEITNQIREQGDNAPWAVGAQDSWTLTDWFENIYARTAGPERYDELFGGELEFTDDSVKEALNEMIRIINNENVPGNIQRALGTGFVDGIGQVFGTNPVAELYMEGGFVGGIALGEVNPDLEVGTDIDFFPFPTINEEHGDPLIGGGDLVAAFENNDGVRQLMEYLASKEAGEIWAETGAIVSPNRAVDLNVYPNELARKEAEQVVNTEVFRFDGSDLLPGDLAENWGALLQNVIRNPGQMDQQLEDFQRQASGEFSG